MIAMALRLALAALVIIAAPAIAHAQSGPALLAQAQAALDELQYEDAAALLDRAWRAGGNRPDDLVQLFRLTGQVAVTLGNDADAELAFRRLLALDPDATLPDGTSPKIAARLDAARATMSKPLGVKIGEPAGQRVLHLEVVSDPLNMIAGAHIRYRDGRGVERIQETRGSGPLTLPIAPSTQVQVDVLDEHGNILVTESFTTRSLAPEPRKPRGPAPTRPVSVDPPDSPFHTRPLTWAAAAAGIGAVGLFFGLRSESAQDELDQLNRNSPAHDFRDALAVEGRLRRDTLIANIGFAAAGATAVVAAVLWLREPRPDRAAIPALTPSATAWTIDWSFSF